jgi:hypothetical protein
VDHAAGTVHDGQLTVAMTVGRFGSPELTTVGGGEERRGGGDLHLLQQGVAEERIWLGDGKQWLAAVEAR